MAEGGVQLDEPELELSVALAFCMVNSQGQEVPEVLKKTGELQGTSVRMSRHKMCFITAGKWLSLVS